MPGPTARLRFTTRTTTPSDRGRVLHALGERGLLPVRPLPGGVPAAELTKLWLPGASVLTGTLAGVRQERDQGGTADDLFLGVNLGGTSRAVAGGREVWIGPGEALVVEPDAGAFAVERPTESRVVGVRIHRHDVRAGSSGPLRVVAAGTPALELLTAYVAAAVRAPAPPAVPLAEAVVAHVADLVGLCLDASGAPKSPGTPDRPGVRAARLAALRADIERHLTDPALSAPALAARHGISTRYLHKLFEDEAVTYSRFVLERRLALAHARLRRPRFAGLTITAVASGCGFGDPAYFNRTFRRRYGRTPSEVRREVG